jgi:hypothetical protein
MTELRHELGHYQSFRVLSDFGFLKSGNLLGQRPG